MRNPCVPPRSALRAGREPVSAGCQPPCRGREPRGRAVRADGAVSAAGGDLRAVRLAAQRRHRMVRLRSGRAGAAVYHRGAAPVVQAAQPCDLRAGGLRGHRRVPAVYQLRHPRPLVHELRPAGAKGAKQAQALVDEVSGLFAGGNIADEDLDVMMKALQDAYWIAKEKNKKFTPKKYRKD